MEGLRWAADNWFVLLQSAGIIAGLAFTGIALRADTKAKRIGNLIALTQHHRQLWSELLSRPELGKLIDPRTAGGKSVATRQEETFIRLLVLHLTTVHRAVREELFLAPEGLRDDIHWFFSFPIPKAIWEKLRPFQDEAFVRFVEECRAGR
ncbi:MAG: hypothetical protein KGS61_13095 [Verrucomicrobia bacterium]|nr:hypothetical protein [Verrucomicrobiota bacterium]